MHAKKKHSAQSRLQSAPEGTYKNGIRDVFFGKPQQHF